jgi:hypothetical protein
VYVSGDGARAFPLGMLNGWNRQIVWAKGDPDSDNESDREDVFVVVDRVKKSSDQINEHILWQCVQEPEIRLRGSPINPVAAKVYDGAWSYYGNRIVITNRTNAGWGAAHGRLIVDTLIPANPMYHKMGGGDNRNIDIFGNLHTANMVNLASMPYAGEWRVEVSSQVRQVDQTYFHVLRVQDADTMETNVTTVRLQSDQIAAQVGNRIFMFSETDTELQSVFCVAQESGLYNLWIGNLTPGAEYTVTASSPDAETLKVAANECGFISLESFALMAAERLTIARYVPAPTNDVSINIEFQTAGVKASFLEFVKRFQEFPGVTVEVDGLLPDPAT